MRAEIRTIAEHYGYDAQSRQLIEEMAELTQAINKFWRKQMECGKKDFGDIPFGVPEELQIAEEIADVEICLEQIKHFMLCHEEVNNFKKYKIERQLKRIEEDGKQRD